MCLAHHFALEYRYPWVSVCPFQYLFSGTGILEQSWACSQSWEHSLSNSYMLQLWSLKYGCPRICSGSVHRRHSCWVVPSFWVFEEILFIILNVMHTNCCSPHTPAAMRLAASWSSCCNTLLAEQHQPFTAQADEQQFSFLSALSGISGKPRFWRPEWTIRKLNNKKWSIVKTKGSEKNWQGQWKVGVKRKVELQTWNNRAAARRLAFDGKHKGALVICLL